MKTNPLGRTGLRVSALGFGGAPIGGLYTAVDDAQAHAALETAWGRGIRYFDTAPLYGAGLSEERLGAFLAGKPRDTFVVSSKVGRVLTPADGSRDTSGSLAAFAGARPYHAVFDFSAAATRRGLEATLQRLQLDRLDVAYVHDPDDHEETALRETLPALRAARAEGLVTAVGVGTNSAAVAAHFVHASELDVVMLAGRYTLLDQSALADVLPLCAERGVAVVLAGVFNSGILATDVPASGATYDYQPAPPEIIAKVERIARRCRAHGVELAAAALQFAAAHPAVAAVVVGMRSSEEVAANAERFAREVPATLWRELRDDGVLATFAPTPGGVA